MPESSLECDESAIEGLDSGFGGNDESADGRRRFDNICRWREEVAGILA